MLPEAWTVPKGAIAFELVPPLAARDIARAFAMKEPFIEGEGDDAIILCEQRRKRRSGGVAPLALELGTHVVERDVVPHDLGGYDE